MFDPDAWIEHLNRCRVDYIVVGGYAGVLHGARRPTVDIDVVPRWDTENLARLCAALRDVEAVSTTGPRTEGAAITPEVLVDREVMTWNTSLGRIDTMVGIPDEGPRRPRRLLHSSIAGQTSRRGCRGSV